MTTAASHAVRHTIPAGTTDDASAPQLRLLQLMRGVLDAALGLAEVAFGHLHPHEVVLVDPRDVVLGLLARLRRGGCVYNVQQCWWGGWQSAGVQWAVYLTEHMKLGHALGQPCGEALPLLPANLEVAAPDPGLDHLVRCR